jgi:hypothetical protein
MSIAWQAFSKAVWHLTGGGTQRERLVKACGPALLELNRKEIPRQLHEEFDEFLQLMGWNCQHYKPRPLDSVASMNDAEVTQAVARILAIYDHVTRFQPTLPAGAGRPPAAPRARSAALRPSQAEPGGAPCP